MKLPSLLKRSALFCALALAAQTLTFAADTAQPQGTADSSTQGYLVNTRQDATKIDRPLWTTPQSVSVVTRQQIQDGSQPQKRGRSHSSPSLSVNA